MTNLNDFKRLIEEGANSFNEYEFYTSVEVDAFCESYKIIQKPYTRQIITAVFGCDGLHFAKEKYPLYWDTCVGITKSMHMFLDINGVSDSGITEKMKSINESDDWDWHGDYVEELYYEDEVEFTELRQWLKDVYNIQNDVIEQFLWETAYITESVYSMKYKTETNNYNDPISFLTTYIDIISIFDI
jgi:hypothetical protein